MIGYLKRAVIGVKPKVSRAQVLGARPVRNPVVTWERRPRLDDFDDREEDAPVVLLRVPRRSGRWPDFVARVFRLPEARKIELDEMGSDVWEMCDGTTTVEALTRAVCAKHHLNRRQAEASVTAYLRMLAERRLVALRTSGSSATRKTEAAVATTGAAQRRGKNERKGRAAARR